jgi:hypothetical protein
MTRGQRICAPLPSGGDVHAPAKRARNPIKARLLQNIQALGPDGIHNAGGLAELARKHGVSGRALANLIREKGTLTALGQAKIKSELLALPTQPITARLLQELSALGPAGIKNAGGVGGLALKHEVSVGGLQKLILRTGRLTAKGLDKIKSEVLEVRHQPITGRLLQELSTLGPAGIKNAGGVGGLALGHGVSVISLRLLIRETGHLTAVGQDKINTEVFGLQHQPITNQLLQNVSALGPAGIKDAGGVGALALKHGVSADSLQKLIRETGHLTPLGQAKINTEVHGLVTQPITGHLLQELSTLGPAGIKSAGGLAGLALKYGVSVNGLRLLILETGRLTAVGQDKFNVEVLGLQHQPITGQLLRELSALGPDRIKRAGGVPALALEHRVSVNGLRQLMRKSGNLTPKG